MVAEERGDLGAAEAWYRKALAVFERLGDEYGAAGSYHQLGILAQERRDLGAAEAWYCKSLDIKERLGDEQGAALTEGQLGLLEAERGRFLPAGVWLLQAITKFAQTNDPHHAEQAKAAFTRCYGQAAEADRLKLRARWEAVPGLPPLPEPPQQQPPG
jgi:tetratricopeptide (TPR) repeat protein